VAAGGFASSFFSPDLRQTITENQEKVNRIIVPFLAVKFGEATTIPLIF
jgi:hypothetical protein